MFDENLVDAIVGAKDLDCGSPQLRVDLGLTRGHGFPSLLLSLTDGRGLLRDGRRPGGIIARVPVLHFCHSRGGVSEFAEKLRGEASSGSAALQRRVQALYFCHPERASAARDLLSEGARFHSRR